MPGLRDFYQQNVASGINRANEAAGQQQKSDLQKQEQDRNLESATGLVNDMAGRGKHVNVKVGDVDVSEAQQNPFMQAAGQAKNFAGMASKAYEPINNALDASRTTLSYLEPGPNGEKPSVLNQKLAAINEVKLGLGSPRGVPSVLQSFGIDSNIPGGFEAAKNKILGTADSTWTNDISDAMRQSVYTRIPELENQHNQAQQKLSTLGASVAPYADTNSIVGAVAGPAQQNLAYLKQHQASHSKGRYTSAAPSPMGAGGSGPTGQPGASQGQSTGAMGWLKSQLSPATSQPAAPQQQAPASGGFNPDAYLGGK